MKTKDAILATVIAALVAGAVAAGSAARVCRMVMKTRRFASEKVVSQSTSKSGMEAASLETRLEAASPN